MDMVIEPSDAVNVLKTIASHLIDVSRNEQNFKRLPDMFGDILLEATITEIGSSE
jgi:hypothetical protein